MNTRSKTKKTHVSEENSSTRKKVNNTSNVHHLSWSSLMVNMSENNTIKEHDYASLKKNCDVVCEKNCATVQSNVNVPQQIIEISDENVHYSLENAILNISDDDEINISHQETVGHTLCESMTNSVPVDITEHAIVQKENVFRSDSGSNSQISLSPTAASIVQSENMQSDMNEDAFVENENVFRSNSGISSQSSVSPTPASIMQSEDVPSDIDEGAIVENENVFRSDSGISSQSSLSNESSDTTENELRAKSPTPAGVITFLLRIIGTVLQYSLMSGFRTNSNLLWCSSEKQFYVKNATSSRVGHGYTCYIDGCKARVHLKGTTCTVANSTAHNHSDQSQLFINFTVLNRVKAILSSPDNKLETKKVFEAEVAK